MVEGVRTTHLGRTVAPIIPCSSQFFFKITADSFSISSKRCMACWTEVTWESDTVSIFLSITIRKIYPTNIHSSYSFSQLFPYFSYYLYLYRTVIIGLLHLCDVEKGTINSQVNLGAAWESMKMSGHWIVKCVKNIITRAMAGVDQASGMVIWPCEINT